MHEAIIVRSCKTVEITEMSKYGREILKTWGFQGRGARSRAGGATDRRRKVSEETWRRLAGGEGER